MIDLQQYGLPYWLDLPRPAYPQMDQDCIADAVVIGAGICGLKMARGLDRLGLQTVILEGARVGAGASSRNQGSINHSAGASYSECVRRYGRAQARELWHLGLENHRLLREQIAEYAIACDYQVDGYTMLARHDMEGWEGALTTYQQDYALLHEDGFAIAYLDETEARRVTGCPLFVGGHNHLTDAQFHSGKYLLGLAANVARLPHVTLFEETRVTKIDRVGDSCRVSTRQGAVTAPLIFLGLNALAPQQVRDLEPGLRAERGQVFVTEPLSGRPCRGGFGTAMAWWREIIEADGRYRLLFGGGRKREEPDSLFPQFTADGQPHPKLETEGFSPSVAHQERLDTQFAQIFPELTSARITHRWGGLQSFTADDLPQMGLLDEERHIYGVAGFSGRGNCYADVGAEYVVGLALEAPSGVERRFGSLIQRLMQVRRSAANWGSWYRGFHES